MQCKSCGTELPKKAKICPKCGALNGKPAGNTRYLAIIGMVIMLIGGLLPFAKSNETLMDGYTPKAYSFGFMNISVIAMCKTAADVIRKGRCFHLFQRLEKDRICSFVDFLDL